MKQKPGRKPGRLHKLNIFLKEITMTPKISLMAFPQKQVGNSLFINVLSIIRNYNPLTTTDLNPAWVNATLRLQAIVIDALDDYPRLDLPSATYD